MALGTLAPTAKFTGLKDDGTPNSGGKLFTYLIGTTTKVNTYSDVDLTVANTNPIILDSAGRATIFLTQGVSYKFVMALSTDTDPPASPLWTVSGIYAPPVAGNNIDLSVTAGEDITAGSAVYMSRGDGALTTGRWYLATTSNDYSSVTADLMGVALVGFASGTTGLVRIDGLVTGLSGLTPGAVYYVSTGGTLTSSVPGSNVRAIGIADNTTTRLVLSHWLKGDGIYTILPTSTGIELSGTLQVDGALTFVPGSAAATFCKPNGVLSVNATPVSSTGATSDLMTYDIPANTLDADGKSIRITASFSCLSNADAKTLAFKFGSTGPAAISFATSQIGYGYASILIYRTGSNTQGSNLLIQVGHGSAAIDAQKADSSNYTETDSGAITVKFVGGGSTTADVTQKTMLVEVMN